MPNEPKPEETKEEVEVPEYEDAPAFDPKDLMPEELEAYDDHFDTNHGSAN